MDNQAYRRDEWQYLFEARILAALASYPAKSDHNVVDE
jgi:hypothetical protein